MLQRYDVMWAAYQERQSINHVSKRAGVAWATAKRAVADGWPRYNLPPLKEKWELLRSEARRTADYDIAERLGDTLGWCNQVDGMVGRIVGELDKIDFAGIFNSAEFKAMGPEKTLRALDSIVEILDRTAKLKAWAAGKPEKVSMVQHEVEVVQHVRRVQEMSDEDLEAIIARARAEGQELAKRSEVDRARAWARAELDRWRPTVPLLAPGPDQNPSGNGTCNPS